MPCRDLSIFQITWDIITVIWKVLAQIPDIPESGSFILYLNKRRSQQK